MRRRWTDKIMITRLREVAAQEDGMMPSARMLRKHPDGNGLCGRIRSVGGFDKAAELAGLPLRASCTRKGWEWEEWFACQAESRGADVERRERVKSPWDVKVNGQTVEVKCSEYSEQGRDGYVRGWFFNMHNQQRCETFAAVCLRNGEPERVYIMPGDEPKSMLTICDGGRGKRERYRDNWSRLGI